MPSSSLNAEVRKVLSRWAKEGFYVYLRPITSRYVEGPNKKHKVYWNVSVELRTVPPGHWEGEGYDLDQIVLEMADRVPRNRIEHRLSAPGWGAPKSVLEAEIARTNQSIKTARLDNKQARSPADTKTRVKSGGKSERPRKKPKRAH